MESRQEFTIVIDRGARQMRYSVNGVQRARVVDFGYTGDPEPNILSWLRGILSSIDAEAAGYPRTDGILYAASNIWAESK